MKTRTSIVLSLTAVSAFFARAEWKYESEVLQNGSWSLSVSVKKVGGVSGLQINDVTSGAGILDLTEVEKDVQKKVFAVGNSAFGNKTTASAYSALTGFVGPDVVSIGEYGFANCTGLESASVSNGVYSIGMRAFYNCTALRSFSPQVISGATLSEKFQFNGCTSLVGDFVVSNAESAVSSFAGTAITSICYPKATTIAESAFSSCKSLTNATFSADLTSIDSKAFQYCYSLAHFSPMNATKLTSIVGSAFQYCGCLSGEFNLPVLTHISGYCFQSTAVTRVSAPLITSIGQQAFQQCFKLAEFEIPTTCTSVGAQAFLSCTSLSNVTVNSTQLNEITREAFYKLPIGAVFHYNAPAPTTLGRYSFCSVGDRSEALYRLYVPQENVDGWLKLPSCTAKADFSEATKSRADYPGPRVRGLLWDTKTNYNYAWIIRAPSTDGLLIYVR